MEERIKKSIEKATRLLLKNDLFLLSNNCDEWSISHKFAEYIQDSFPEWHVDVEYNRDRDQIKTLENEIVRPDIIVHIRDTSFNHLVFEVKKSNQGAQEIDEARQRLVSFTNQNGRYHYDLGIIVIFGVMNDVQLGAQFEFYQNGERILA